MKKIIYLFILMLMTIGYCLGSDFEELCKDGYAVVSKTYINGSFEGCDFDKLYRLANGLIFQCSEYNYSYSYNPDFFILKNQYGSMKFIIDDEEFSGNIFR